MNTTHDPEAPTAKKSRPVRALVVDDDEALRFLVTVALTQNGIEVIEAADGSKAFEMFRKHAPDIILLDVMMPTTDGFQVCAAIRAHAAGRHVPILMMTGLDDVQSIDRAYDAGATDFIAKPVNYPNLPHRVRYMLRTAMLADELRSSEARLARAQNMARLGHWEWNLTTNELMCSELVEQWFDIRNNEPLEGSQRLLCNVHPDDRARLEAALRRGFEGHTRIRIAYRVVLGDETLHLEQDATFGHSGEDAGLYYTGVVRDVTERVKAEQQAHEIRNFDEVTGLPNRFLMKQKALWAMDLAQRHGRKMAVLALNLDQFKRINDSLGYESGDGVLRAVAARLLKCVRQTDLADGENTLGRDERESVARLGGDEFVVVLSDISSADDAAIVAQRIRKALAEPLTIGTQQIVVSASIGISTYPSDGESVEELLKHAGAALNSAKRKGRDVDQFFSATIDARAFERFSMEADLRKALDEGQFELWYQPKVRACDHTVAGAEALVRWRHPDHGMVSPLEFIPIAEDTGLIVPLGEWITAEACRHLATWANDELAELRIAINLSAAQFAVPGIEKFLINSAAACGILPDRLELELTESVVMRDVDKTIKIFRELEECNFRIWIDDFGTGYSSLSYLKTLPINGLKIDQSFVREMHTNADDASIVAAVCMLARGLGLDVVAEGVEMTAQVDSLRTLGCDYLQGYFFHAPMPVSEFGAWVREGGGSQAVTSAA